MGEGPGALACFKTLDTGEVGCDTHTIDVKIPCDHGCTRTQGYWKTHSKTGPAPYDNTWDKVGTKKEHTAFFKTIWTWISVLWTPPTGGNADLIAGKQYVAAALNKLSGAAVPPAVAKALARLEAHFKGEQTLSKSELLAEAGILEKYNEGDLGVAHCDEK